MSRDPKNFLQWEDPEYLTRFKEACQSSEFYRQLSRTRYQTVRGFAPADYVQLYATLELEAFRADMKQVPDSAMPVFGRQNAGRVKTSIINLRMIEQGCHMHWLAPNLVRALEFSKIPKGLDLSDLPLFARQGFLMLPLEGSLWARAGICALSYSFIEPEDFECSGELFGASFPIYHTKIGEPGRSRKLLFSAVTKNFDLDSISGMVDVRGNDIYYGPMGADADVAEKTVDPAQEKERDQQADLISRASVALILQVAMLKAIRPELFEEAQVVRSGGGGFGAHRNTRQTLFSPNWIGKSYQIPRRVRSTPKTNGSRKSPNWHLVSGYWKPRLSERLGKAIWVEPYDRGSFPDEGS